MGDEFKIEKDVPIPAPSNNIGRYPFRQLNIGESVHIEIGEAKFSSLRSRLTHIQQKTGARFATRKTETGIRVWRIE